MDFISDQSINDFLTLIMTEYKVAASVFGGAVIWALRKFTKWTPWTSDDQIVDKLAARLGLGGKE